MNQLSLYDRLKKLLPKNLRTQIRRKMPISLDYRLQQYMDRKNEKLQPEKIEYREKRFEEALRNGLENIPIFLISYNRLSYLKTMIQWLEERNLRNIKIIDNDSTYPPLLEFYDRTEYEVFRLGYNGGHTVFWKDPIFAEYRKEFYILSDPDLQAIEECPDDVIKKLFECLREYRFVNKAGMALKIDDIPEDGIFGNQVVRWEKRFYRIQVEKDVFFAPIDTTFALYLPEDLFEPRRQDASLRVGYPYQVRHLPWYKKQNELTDEDIFYSELQTNGWWNTSVGKATKDKY